MEFDKFSKVNAFLRAYQKGYVPAGLYQVQVKLDGANAGIIRTEEGLALHSRNTFLGNLQAGNLGDFGGLSGFVEFVRERFTQLYDALKVGDHVYGEWLVPHTIQYPAEMYKKFYIFDDKFQYLVDKERGILSTPRLADIQITDMAHEDGVTLINRIMAIGKAYADSMPYKTEGIVLTRYNTTTEDLVTPLSYTKFTDRFKVIFPEFREEKGEKWGENKGDLPLETCMAAEYSIRSYEKIKEKVKDLKSVDTLSHQHIGPVLGLAWNDYLQEFLGDVVKEYKFPTVRFGVLKSEFDKRVREMLLSELNTGQLPAWALTQSVREAVREGV